MSLLLCDIANSSIGFTFSSLCKQPLECDHIVSQPCTACLLQSQVFCRPPAVPQAHSQVVAQTPPLDADQLHMLPTKYPANPQQLAPTPLPQPSATPCPADPTSLILAGIPLPRLAHLPAQALQADQEVVQRKDSWSGPAGTALSLRSCLSRFLLR